MPEFTVDWTTMHTAVWSMVLDKFKGQPNVTALEIGAFEGRSTVWFLENILTGSDCFIVAVEPFCGNEEFDQMGIKIGGMQERFHKNTHEYQIAESPSSRCRLFRGTSAEWFCYSAISLDFVYVDGCHEAGIVLCDSVKSWYWLNKGGILIFDDYIWGEGLPDWKRPQPAIDSFLACYNGRYKILAQTTQMILEKVF